MFIHENTYKKITFLKKQSAMFISWICPRLKPMIDSPGQYIYFEGDEVQCIYFLKQGKCGTVLPRHRNMKYIDFPLGCFFGEVDLVYESIENCLGDAEGCCSSLSLSFQPDAWMNNKDKIKRHFTVMADKRPPRYCEMLTLSLNDLENMSSEFIDSYRQIFGQAHIRLQRSLKIKMTAIQHCKQHLQIDSETCSSSSEFTLKSDESV